MHKKNYNKQMPCMINNVIHEQIHSLPAHESEWYSCVHISVCFEEKY